MKKSDSQGKLFSEKNNIEKLKDEIKSENLKLL